MGEEGAVCMSAVNTNEDPPNEVKAEEEVVFTRENRVGSAQRRRRRRLPLFVNQSQRRWEEEVYPCFQTCL